MQYVSTRDRQAQPTPIGIDAALNAGLASDGGLFVPLTLPRVHFDDALAEQGLAATAAVALAPFFVGSRLAEQLPEICAASLNLPLPVHPLPNANVDVLELFHGPTAAFKDFAARFLSACMQRLRSPNDPLQTVLVATSGDTGGAVAAAFHQKPGFEVLILFPDGRVAARQAHQLSAFGGNVRTYKVQGTFDDCQALVKRAFSDAVLRSERPLLSANSISLGRLLPQMAYYVFVALRHRAATGTALNLIIPSGNLGHGLGALLARCIGAPIGEIVLASNANDVLPRYFQNHVYNPRASLDTLANAMDVGAPSNFERMHWLFEQNPSLRNGIQAYACSDAAIQHQIKAVAQSHDYVICPHTACGFEALRQIRLQQDQQHWMIAATAHAAKFDSVVEPLLQRSIPVPSELAALLAKPASAQLLANDYAELLTCLR